MAICKAVGCAETGLSSLPPRRLSDAHFFTGEKKATGMAIFSVGGNFGFSPSPIMVPYLCTYYGLKGAGFFSIPGVVRDFFYLTGL